MKKLGLIIWMPLVLLFCGFPVWAGGGDVYVMPINGSINPGVAEFVQKGVEKAVAEQAACLIIQLDTPGGLAESMRQIVQSILASPVPIIVYVSPGGARAASAGVMITIAADIAAMAPGTNIGAAHPVSAGGKEINDTMGEKVTNDMVAHARSVAEKRGRNADWVEQAIRESVSVTETEAVKKMVVDLVAEDIKELITLIDGRDISGKGKLEIKGAAVIPIPENLRTKILQIISDPNIAYILMMIGLAGLYFEFSQPGAVLPGVVGAIALILAFFAFQTLPVNYAGMLLILAAVIFFILEFKITSYGMLSIAGIVSLILGSLMLFDEEPGGGLRLAWAVFIPTVILVSGFFVLVAGLVFRSRMARPRTGESGLVGQIGIVKKPLTPDGKVFVHGELWHATASSAIEAGARVRVKTVKNLVLYVEKEE